MFVFSRRWLQSCIDDLAGVLGEEALQALVARLNRKGEGRLAAMWELVFLKGMAHAGRLRHEVTLSNGRSPDFDWTVPLEGAEFQVIGDITTVSDAGLKDRNPVRYLFEEIVRLARKHRLNPAHFRYEVPGIRVGEHPKSTMQLLLPKKDKLQELIKAHLEPFIRQLAQVPQAKAHFSYKDEVTEVSVTYDRSQNYAGGGHLAFDVAVSLTNNPIFKALKAKTSQLSCAPEDAMRLVMLCDADCAALSSQHMPPNGYPAHKIAAEFLRQSKSVDMVLLVTVQNVISGICLARKLLLRFEPIVQGPHARSSRVTEDRIQALLAALEKAVSEFPDPLLEPVNAVRRCAEKGYGLGKRGGYKVSFNNIRISSRALLQLLSGDISQDQFFEAHGWNKPLLGDIRQNQFRLALERGLMFGAARVEAVGNEDDDWIEFDFTDPDPAISPFRVRGAPTSNAPGELAGDTRGKGD